MPAPKYNIDTIIESDKLGGRLRISFDNPRNAQPFIMEVEAKVNDIGEAVSFAGKVKALETSLGGPYARRNEDMYMQKTIQTEPDKVLYFSLSMIQDAEGILQKLFEHGYVSAEQLAQAQAVRGAQQNGLSPKAQVDTADAALDNGTINNKGRGV